MRSCLVVDEDPGVLDQVATFMRHFGYRIQGTDSGSSMRRMIASEPFDIVILDLQVRDENGIALCNWLRGHTTMAVILLSAQADPHTRILALEMGADDIVAKPFEPRELVARANAILRRLPERASPIAERVLVRFDDWSFDRVSRNLVSRDNVVVPLSPVECRLLEVFLGKPKTVVSREELQRFLGGQALLGRSIDLAISRLRRKLRDSAGLIRTIRSEDYLFNAIVVGRAGAVAASIRCV